MPNITPVQSDFSVGEVAPDLQMRSTLDAQRRGVKTLTNFVADSRGPIIRRKGFRFLGKVGEPILIPDCDANTLVRTQRYQANNANTGNEISYTGYRFKLDGTEVYMTSGSTGGLGRGYYTFQMTTPWDISTVQNASITFKQYVPLFSGYAGNAPTDLFISPDGVYAFSCDSESADTGGGGGSPSRIYRMTLGTPWDFSSAVELADGLSEYIFQSGDVGLQSPTDFDMSPDGLNLFVVMNDPSQKIHQYALSTPFVLNSENLTYLGAYVVPIPNPPGGNYFIRGMRFVRTGNRFTLPGQFAEVYVYDMSTPWDVLSASYTKTIPANSLSPLWSEYYDDCQYMFNMELSSNAFLDKYDPS